MTFPTDPLGTRVDFRIGGVWTNVTPDVYLGNIITITRGRRDQGARVDPGKCSLTLKNLDGKYSPRNPLSPYYGLLGRNTPVRVSVHTGTPYLSLDGDPANHVSTPDTAALDLTGDLDIRAEVTMDWEDLTRSQVLISKWETVGDQRSYLLRVFNGILTLNWSVDGTAATSFFAGQALPALRGRKAVRVTLDADNGTGVYEVRMYYADSLAGPWTQIGSVAVGSVVASIFASTAPLKVAGQDTTTTPNRTPFIGRGHSFEVRNSIDGTVVASPDFTAQDPGVTSFADSAGRGWTVQGAAEITNRQTRFTGEISSWPPTWGVTGRIVRVPVEAAGILRRYRQGKKALFSTLRRRIPSDPDLLAYWPMEEDRDATQAYSPITGVPPMITSDLTFAADDSLAGSAALPSVGSSARIEGIVPESSTGEWQVEFVYFLETMPGSLATMMEVRTTGTVRTHRLRVQTDNVQLQGLDADGAEVYLINVTAPFFTGAWTRLQIAAVPDGANVELTLRWTTIGGGSALPSETYTGTVGRVVSVGGAFGSGLDGLKIGHMAVFETSTSTIFNEADTGFAGESALTRMRRVADEEGLPLIAVDGDATLSSERVGPQRLDTLLNVVESAADVDGGILYEDREQLRLTYRDHFTLQNQTPQLVLDYTGPGEVAPPLEPVEDDTGLRNDITVTRDGGSSAQVVLDEGPLSVLDPPDGVGRYDESITLNLADDDQPVQHASWRVHLGTWDEARVPAVTVKLHKAPHLIDDAAAVDVGDRLQITNPPPWLPPDPIDLLAQGYIERIGVRTWDIEYTCSPAGPWNVAFVEDPKYGWMDTDGSELTAAVSSSATELYVATTEGPYWITTAASIPADFPLDIRVGGEVMTVTGIADSVVDAFGRTVSPGWGTADSGQAWTTSGGVASDYTVASGQGRHTCSTVNVSRRTVLTPDTDDVDLYCLVAANALSTGGSQYGGPIARYTTADNLYQLRVEFTTSATVVLELRKRTAATETQLAAYTAVGHVHTAGTFLAVRFQAVGSALKGRLWAPATETEPGVWHVEATDTDHAAGQVGVRSILAPGNTNVSPVLAYDELVNRLPQVMTVTRSVNGVVKAQSAGADVRLAYPAIVSL